MEQFWSDNFDMDLLKVLPETLDVLGDTADTPLWTYGGTSYGRLNHPTVWNGYGGMVAYFGTDDTGGWKPGAYYTGRGLVECTWLEVCRDAWPHQYIVHVNGAEVWNTGVLWKTFEALMWDLRGWRKRKLPPGRAGELKAEVLDSLRGATRRLLSVLADAGVR